MIVLILLLIACFSSVARAQTEEPVTVLEHPAPQPFYLGGQVNLIFQHHVELPAPYTGTQSFKPTPERKLSSVLTLYTGVRIGRGWDVVFDLESAGGHGLSDALGLAGFTDLDVVRNPSLGSAPYLARL